MKFTDGFWLMREEYDASFPSDIREITQMDGRLVFYAPYKRIKSRGDTLNVGLLTVAAESYLDGVIRVNLRNFKGGKPQLKFPICEKQAGGEIEITGEGATLKSGALSLSVKKGEWGLNFSADGRKLVSSTGRETGVIRDRSAGATYMVGGLSLDVGELVYGLGERFGPLVKNGQSIDIRNEDGGTASEQSYKNIPFYYTSKGYGVFVNNTDTINFEVGSEKVETVQFSSAGQELEFFIIYGPTPKQIFARYTQLTGRAPLLPEWSYGLWLSTSFTTNYNEETVMSFVSEMERREIPLGVFHFDCFWMKEFEWTSLLWDRDAFPDAEGMLSRLHERGLRVCVWINSYIAQKSPLFDEGLAGGYFLKRADGDVWQWDMWQAGMALVDFTNPEAAAWFQSKLKALTDMGVDAFKTDFGERIPTDAVYFSGADASSMHNFYTYLYNKCVYELLAREKGEGEAVLFARSATAGSQAFPLHWGGDSTSTYVSMAETLRGGLSLSDSGFAYWSHDIGGFEDKSPAHVYKRWLQFGLLCTHSRLHGSSSYRVPWNYDEESCEVCRRFVAIKRKLTPYLMKCAREASQNGTPILRAMHFNYPSDDNCAYLDRQYMLGDDIIVAPIFGEDGEGKVYLPEGEWTDYFTRETVRGGAWRAKTCDFLTLPLFIRVGG
ncbi:MAG: alpha-xylosidase, partial [Oscillospiraceae bacterium]|nr:alpha-xylosidase [Oscillospiraceae bacterium]